VARADAEGIVTPDRVAPGGNFRFNRIFKGVGRIRQSSGTRKIGEYRERNAILTKLARAKQRDVLRAFKRGDLDIDDLVEADREGELDGAKLLARIKLRKNLWTAIEETLPAMGKSAETRDRYRTSLAKLKRVGVTWLPESADVRSLLDVRWGELREQGSAP
jgi:hypothetical protein